MLRQCDHLVKDAWKLVSPIEQIAYITEARTAEMLRADRDMLARDPDCDEFLKNSLTTQLGNVLFHQPFADWHGVDERYRCLLLMLRHKDKLTSVTIPVEQVMALLRQARPMYNQLSGKDPFPDVFETA